MLNRLMSSVRRAGRGSHFDNYYSSVAGSGLPGAPTADEAKREYSKYMLEISKNPWR